MPWSHRTDRCGAVDPRRRHPKRIQVQPLLPPGYTFLTNPYANMHRRRAGGRSRRPLQPVERADKRDMESRPYHSKSGRFPALLEPC
jgi:hypothetical protein